MAEWNSKGCEVCRKMWLSGNFPEEVAVNIERHASLHCCPVCKTLWEQNERYADVISDTDAAKFYSFQLFQSSLGMMS
jgi:hypothetical protein